MAAFALTGCGARDSLDLGDTRGPPPDPAIVIDLCDTNLGFGLREPHCGFRWQDAPDTAPVFEFEIMRPYLPDLQPGAVFQVSSEFEAPMNGARLSATKIEAITGWVAFTTYDPHGGATGSFDLQFADGTASGTFSAERCYDLCGP